MTSGDFPHTLFYGPPGAGKKTLVLALLRELFGAGVEKVSGEGKGVGCATALKNRSRGWVVNVAPELGA